MQNSVGQQNIPKQPVVQMTQQNQVQQAQPTQVPSVQTTQGGQNVAVPNYSGVNIQIFNPSVTPPGATAPVYNVNSPNYSSNPVQGCYPSDYYTGKYGIGQTNTTSSENKKTEKREIVKLTDEYIKTLENYLNSQDKEIRLMGAKEVVARLEEDHSRKDDPALNALVNKMLQDPSKEIKFLALAAVNSRIASGDNLTVQLLQQMQNSQSGYGQDALDASNALLKMAGQTTEKEFEVKSNQQTTTQKQEKQTEG